MATEIDYEEPATYYRRETGGSSSGMSFGEMPLYQAVLLAIRKYRVTQEPAVTSKSLRLIGIDAIVALRDRPDFPTNIDPV